MGHAIRALISAAIAVAALPGHAAEANPEFRLLELDGRKVSWALPARGLPPVVTYAMIEKPRSFPQARNCGDMLPPERALAASRIATADFKAEVRAAFAMWQRVARINFRETVELSRADILIGAQAQPRGRAFTNVARREEGSSSSGQIQQSLICLNPETRWKIGFDGNLDVYDLRYTIAHEIGHAIGLDHPGRDGQLMSYRYAETSRELRPGDIKGAVEIYGPRTLGRSIASRALSRELNASPPRQQPSPGASVPQRRQSSLGLDAEERPEERHIGAR